MIGCKTFFLPMFCCGLRLIVTVNRMEHHNKTEEKHTFACIGLVERVSLYITSALIVQSHDDREVGALIVKRPWSQQMVS